MKISEFVAPLAWIVLYFDFWLPYTRTDGNEDVGDASACYPLPLTMFFAFNHR